MKRINAYNRIIFEEDDSMEYGMVEQKNEGHVEIEMIACVLALSERVKEKIKLYEEEKGRDKGYGRDR